MEVSVSVPSDNWTDPMAVAVKLGSNPHPPVMCQLCVAYLLKRNKESQMTSPKKRILHPEFEHLYMMIEATLSDNEESYTGRVNDSIEPPLALYHTILDGKEYIVSILPTDLPQAAVSKKKKTTR